MRRQCETSFVPESALSYLSFGTPDWTRGPREEETRGQGDRETRGQGDKERRDVFPLVSLSPCPLVHSTITRKRSRLDTPGDRRYRGGPMVAGGFAMRLSALVAGLAGVGLGALVSLTGLPPTHSLRAASND